MEIERVVGIIGEPARAYNYEVYLPLDFASYNDVQRLRVLCYEVSLPPLISIEAEREFPFAPGYYIPRPTGIEIGEVSMRFWETEDRVVQRYFRRWQGKMVKLDSGRVDFAEFSLPRMYLRDVDIWVVGVDGHRKWGWKLVRSFPTRVEMVDLSYSSNDVISVGVSFVFEHLEELGK